MTNKKLIRLSKEALKKMEAGSLQYNCLLMCIQRLEKLEEVHDTMSAISLYAKENIANGGLCYGVMIPNSIAITLNEVIND